MPFIPHTDGDVAEMLAAIGADSVADLFDEIPAELRIEGLDAIGPALSEEEIARLMQTRARADGEPLCFLGAGAYDHHIPAAVWDLAQRGEPCGQRDGANPRARSHYGGRHSNPCLDHASSRL